MLDVSLKLIFGSSFSTDKIDMLDIEFLLDFPEDLFFFVPLRIKNQFGDKVSFIDKDVDKLCLTILLIMFE